MAFIPIGLGIIILATSVYPILTYYQKSPQPISELQDRLNSEKYSTNMNLFAAGKETFSVNGKYANELTIFSPVTVSY
jgi:hypothetical protein